MCNLSQVLMTSIETPLERRDAEKGETLTEVQKIHRKADDADTAFIVLWSRRSHWSQSR